MKKKCIMALVFLCLLFSVVSGVACNCNGEQTPPHTCRFSEKVAESRYKRTDEDCQAKATYYYSCTCGEKGTEYFEFGEYGNHKYKGVTTLPTCENQGYTTYTCDCGDSYVGDYVDRLNHTFTKYISNGDGTHTAICATDNSHTAIINCTGKQSECLKKPLCDYCGEEYGEAGGHVYNSEYDQKNHWRACKCGSIIDVEQHNFSVLYKVFDCVGNDEYEIRFCLKCGYLQEVGEKVIHPHDYVKMDDIIPTCTESGIINWYQCGKCNKDIYKEEIAPLGHLLTGEKIYDVEFDYQCYYQICQRENCDEKVYQGHDYTWTVINEPNCIEGGKAVGVCDCGKEIETTFAVDHDWGEWKVETPATCTEYGEEVKECLICGKKEYRVISITHEWTIWYVKNSETCTTNGMRERKCLRCGETETKVILASHKWGEWQTVEEPTCIKQGTFKRQCLRCEETEEKHSYASHVWGNWSITKNATCFNDGEKTRKCINCNKIDTAIIKASHKWDKGKITLKPTCTTEGKITYTCNSCGSIKTENLLAYGHSFKIYTQHPTCTESGYSISTCVRCGLQQNKYLGALGHNLTYSYNSEKHWLECSRDNCNYKSANEDSHTLQTVLEVEEIDDGAQITYRFTLLNKCSICGYKDIINQNAVHVHYGVEIIPATVTCETDGYSAGLKCSVIGCNEIIVAPVYTSKLGHIKVTISAKAPTCTENGWEAYEKCIRPNCDYTTYVKIDKLGHDYVKGICTRCGTEEFHVHSYDKIKYNATSHWYECSCGQTQGLENHKGGTATCQSKAQCVVCLQYYETVKPCSYGSWIIQTSATCINSGLKYKQCIWCEEKITSIIPALGHNLYETDRKYANCTENGYVKYGCTRCSYTKTTTIFAGEHNISITDKKDATCTQDGYIKYECSQCDYEYIEQIAGGHVYQVISQKQASKTESGYVEYKCVNCNDKYTEVIPAIGDGEYVLLVQDRVPWTIDNAVAMLKKLESDGYISGWGMTTASNFNSVDLSLYSVIYVSNDQTTSTYNVLGGLNEEFTEFVENGGVLVYGACDHGWASGNISYALPGGVQRNSYYSRNNYIVNNEHEIITGALTGGKGIDNYLLQGTYCSHSGFIESSLPQDTQIIIEDGKGLPTLISYPLGEGYVIASGLTWEFYYTRPFVGDTTYSKNVFDDLIVYATTLSNTCEHVLTQVKVVEPTCTERGYTEYLCGVCNATLRKNYVDRTALIYVQRVNPTCTLNGNVEYWYCNDCGKKFSDQENRIEVINVVLQASHTGEAVWIKTSTTHLKKYECCGEIVISEEDHTFNNGICELCNYVCLHVGGTATCKEQSTCEICGSKYGGFANHVYENNECIWCGDINTPKTDEYIRVDKDGTENPNGEYILFGSYPQTLVSNTSITANLNTLAGTKPTTNNNYNWISYGYYVSGKVSNYMWYIDLTLSGKQYRGVYLSSYRPYYCDSSSIGSAPNYYAYNIVSSSQYSKYNLNTAYWFEYEPLTWRILKENNGSAMLLCENIIDSQQYDYDGSYNNNYKESTIRKWLNETFYQTAFSKFEQQIIQTTLVDNSARSTNPNNNVTQFNSGKNSYACENTSDKVFLLSMQEVTNSSYGFSSEYSNYDSIRRKKTTDYARSQGCYTYTSSSYLGNGSWWLRSPYYGSSNYARHVYFDGNAYFINSVNYTSRGVVPALTITL